MRRFNRYKNLQSELQQVINEITYEKKKTLNETLSTQYGESFIIRVILSKKRLVYPFHMG